MSSRLEGGLSIGVKVLVFFIRGVAAVFGLAVAIQIFALIFMEWPDAARAPAYWIALVVTGAISFGLVKAASWVKKTGAQKLAQQSARLAQIETAIGTKLDQELTARKTLADGRRALMGQVRARRLIGVLKVTVLGGSGWEDEVKQVLHLTLDEHNLYLANEQRAEERAIPLADLSKVDIAGPGTFTSGGGFGGGGFGVEGFVVGAAAASVLNALTTRTKTETLIYLRFKETELVLLNGEEDLEGMRIRLSPLFVRVKNAAEPVQGGFDVAEQLARLAELKGKGELSDEEYSLAKAKVLTSP